MKFLLPWLIILSSVVLNSQTRYTVSNSTEFNTAQDQAVEGDTIVWLPGIYYNTRMEIDKDGIIVTADPYGSALFTGASRARIVSDHVTFSGFQYIGGNIANLHVIEVLGSNISINHINIKNYTSHKYLILDEVCRRNIISYCNFENRLNLVDQNILSVLVDDEPGFHKIQHCSFKNFDGIGGDMGIEPIRIGVSSQGHLDSRTLVEYCYFTRCNGDGEIISHKSRQNVYRYNTFEDNPLSELVLRHGDEGIVYGNFFLNNRGGIRIREGSDHFIYNNYFEGIQDRSIFIMNDPVDPPSGVHIYHNTFVNSEELRLGGSGSNPPTNITLANNVFADPLDQLLYDNTGNESWISNVSFGKLGIDLPDAGLLEIDPLLYLNTEGYFQPEVNSPLISASGADYPLVPLYPGMEYDHEIMLDIMKESRAETIPARAIGASEYSPLVSVKPHATESNTGPSYLFDNLVDYVTVDASQLYIGGEGDVRAVNISSNIDWAVSSTVDWVSLDLSSGSSDARLIVTIDANLEAQSRAGLITVSGGTQTVTIAINQDPGDITPVQEFYENEVIVFPNPTNGKIQISNLTGGFQTALLEITQLSGDVVLSNEYSIHNDQISVDLGNLMPGLYLMELTFASQSRNQNTRLIRKIVIDY